jgi:large conductance mechanosensitive channel
MVVSKESIERLHKHLGIVGEFREFLREYKVLSLAIAFIIGGAATALIQSLVNDIIMPFVGVLIPGGDWKQAVFQAGPVMLKLGSFVSNVINFAIIAFAVFVLAKVVLRDEKPGKK